MCYNARFISYYNLLCHYYVLLFFLLFFLLCHMGLLFFLLFFLLWHIIFHYFSYYFQLWQGGGICKMARGRQQFLTQAWRNDSNSVYEECQLIFIDRKAHIQNGKLPEGVFLYYYTHYFFLLYALFDLADHDCGRCKCVLGTAFLCTLLLCVATSLWDIGEAANAVWSAQTVLPICYYFALCHYYCNYFFNYTHYSKTKTRFFFWISLQITG